MAQPETRSLFRKPVPQGVIETIDISAQDGIAELINMDIRENQMYRR